MTYGSAQYAALPSAPDSVSSGIETATAPRWLEIWAKKLTDGSLQFESVKHDFRASMQERDILFFFQEPTQCKGSTQGKGPTHIKETMMVLESDRTNSGGHAPDLTHILLGDRPRICDPAHGFQVRVHDPHWSNGPRPLPMAAKSYGFPTKHAKSEASDEKDSHVVHRFEWQPCEMVEPTVRTIPHSRDRAARVGAALASYASRVFRPWS